MDGWTSLLYVMKTDVAVSKLMKQLAVRIVIKLRSTLFEYDQRKVIGKFIGRACHC